VIVNDDFAFAQLKPDGEMLYDDEFSLFLIQVKSDSEFGALLNNDPTEFYRRNIRDILGDETDVRATVVRANAEIPANPRHTSQIVATQPGNSATVTAVQYKYPKDMRQPPGS